MSAFAAAAVCLSGWGALSLSGVAGTAAGTPDATASGLTQTLQPVVTDPGCVASPLATGPAVVCQSEGTEGQTAAGFGTKSCDHIADRDSTLDYFVFVLPAAGDAKRTFTSPPAPLVWFDNSTTPVTGVIAGDDAKFFYASASQGTTELEAQAATDNDVVPTSNEFVLTHTCPATSSSSTSSSSTTSTGTTTTGTTTTGTTTTESTTTGTTTTGTSTTTTGSQSGTTTTQSSSTTSTVSGGVLGTSSTTVSSSSSSSGGVGGISTPNTGAGANSTLSTALLGFGLSFLLAGGVLGRRRKS